MSNCVFSSVLLGISFGHMYQGRTGKCCFHKSLCLQYLILQNSFSHKLTFALFFLA